ncbi:MAG: iron-containing alcohol dehydrogenase family protein [Rickettsiales bacterium]|nr:MAG: iron-containing alcohol dehydrogenase family protein [Rickettsiales bacterium]
MSKSVFLADYTIGIDAYSKVPEICEKYGKKVVFIGGKTALEKSKSAIMDAIKGSKLEVIDTIWFGGEASYENVEKLKQEKAVQEADMVFAFGGGKATDTCKSLTNAIKKPLFTFPTIAATCAYTTMICAMYNPDGSFKDCDYRYAPAEHCFINTKIIAEAPDKYLWAGIGDTLAKGYEPEFSARGKDLDFWHTTGVTLSKLCQEPLVKYGINAMQDCKNNKVSNDLEETILTIIVTTGAVSCCVTFDYNSSIGHAICYGFSVIKRIEEKHLHGELVSYGVLVLLMIDNKIDEIKKLLPLYRTIKLPTTYHDFGATEDEIENKVLEKATQVGDIKVSAFPINKDVLRKGIQDYENFIKNN